MEPIVCLTIDGDPVSKQRPRIGKAGKAYTPRATKQAESVIAWTIRADSRSMKPSSGLFSVHVWFFTKDLRRRDIDNLCKTVLDACNGIVWDDDSQVVELHACVERGSPRPRTVLLIKRKQ